jgi:hypothetical protein
MNKVFVHAPVELTEMQTVNKDGGRKYITPEDVALPSITTIIAVDEYAPQVFIEHRDNWVRPLKETIAQWNDENSTSLFV